MSPIPDELGLTIPSADGGIPATWAVPAGGVTGPAVLLLHGTASHRDEVGGMYAGAAAALAVSGIASLRIDFAGCGDSPRPQADYTVTSQLADARAAFAWLCGRDDVDSSRIGVLGFSQGGMIASLLVGSEPRAAALATWSSGIVASPYGAFGVLAPAFAHGAEHTLVDLGFRQFTFSRTWWDEVRAMDLAAALASYDRPLLALAGADDDLVAPTASAALVGAAASRDATVVEFAGADHIFNVLGPGEDLSAAVIETTADWFAQRLLRAGARIAGETR